MALLKLKNNLPIGKMTTREPLSWHSQRVVFFFCFVVASVVEGFVSRNHVVIGLSNRLFMSAPVEQDRITPNLSYDEEGWQDPDAPAGIEGAEFFGGNKQKEEFFDPVAERQAAEEVQRQVQKSSSYGRFFSDSQQQLPSEAFDNPCTARLGQSLQQYINSILHSSTPHTQPRSTVKVEWTQKLSWNTPFVTGNDSGSSPSAELQSARDFYKQIDLAIVSGKQVSDTLMDFSWELSVVWPIFWAPRVLLSGTSTLTLNEALYSSSDTVTITNQVDRVFGCSNNNILPLLASQIMPRFWDWYHIGMCPTTEQMPRQTIKKGKYTVYQLPSRLVMAPTVVETGTRETRTAEMVPNHAFTCIIKTMGPQKQDYVPTSPIQVQIGRRKTNIGEDVNNDQLEISWSVPLSTQFQAINNELLLPGKNPEDKEGTFPTCSYKLQSRRQVATIAYGGDVQDPEITKIRKLLYDQVLKDGWKPRLDEDGRPMFFFWQSDAKACYTQDGLGMLVYEWRPKLANSNEVGIELQMD
jgi:hypothetical protein